MVKELRLKFTTLIKGILTEKVSLGHCKSLGFCVFSLQQRELVRVGDSLMLEANMGLCF